MSDDNFDNLDDFDLDDFDFDSDFENPDGAGDDRTVIDQLRQGAVDQLKDIDFAADVARSVARNSLPEGYSAGLSRLDQIRGGMNDLYDEARKKLERPFKDVMESVHEYAKNQDEGGIRDFIVNLTETEKNEGPKAATKEDPNEAKINAALATVFRTSEESRERDLALHEHAQEQELTNTTLVVDQLKRLTTYQDTIDIDYRRKALELQHRQYFTAEKTFELFKAYAEDQKEANKAITRNTGLPDFLKINLTEAYQEEAQNRILGMVNETAADHFGNYGSKLLENAKNRVREKSDEVVEAFQSIQEIVDALREADDMEGVSTAEIIGGMISGQAAEFLGEKAAERIKRLLEKNPKVAKYAEEIAFLAENYPTELDEAIANWDGQVFPDKWIERFPILGRISSEFLSDELRAIRPMMDDQTVSLQDNLSGLGGMEARFFDEISRKTLIEIIPGYMSRMLEQLTIANYGQNVERVTYDVNTGMFRGINETIQEAMVGLQGGRTVTDDDVKQNIRESLNSGSSQVTDSQQEMLIDTIRGLDVRSKMINEENILKDVEKRYGKDASNNLRKVVRQSGRNEKDSNEFFQKISKELKTGLRREVVTRDAFNEINPGRTLSSDASLLAEEWLSSHSAMGTRPKPEEFADNAQYLGSATPEAIEEIENYFLRSRLPKRRIDRIIARASRDISKTFQDTQKEVNRLVGLGQQDILNEAGLVTTNTRGKAVVNRDIMNRFEANEVTSDNGLALRERPGGFAEPLAREPQEMDQNSINRIVEQLAFIDDQRITSQGRVIDTLTERTILNVDFLDDTAVRTVPVTIIEDRTKVQQDMQQDPMKQKMYDLVEKGFMMTAQQLDLLVQKDSDEQPKDRGGIFERLLTASGGWAKGAGSVVSSYVKGVHQVYASAFNLGAAGVGAAGNVAGGLFAGIKPKQDIFVEGESDPVISARDLRKGKFIDENTGKVIKSIKDITGPVIDRAGNSILTAQQAAAGLFNREGESLLGGGLGRLRDLGSDALGTVFNVNSFLMEKGIGAVKAVTRGAGNLLDTPVDVFVVGEELPRLTAGIMRNGGYYSEGTGEPVLKPRDIDGPVRDASGENTLITHEDIAKGLVDRWGNNVLSAGVVNMAKRTMQLGLAAGKKALDFSIGTAKMGVRAGMGILGAGKRAATGLVNVVTGNALKDAAENIAVVESALKDGVQAGDMAETNNYLDATLRFLMARFPIEEKDELDVIMAEQTEILRKLAPEKIKGDTDGDGDRDGSLRDILGNRGKATDNPEATTIEREAEQKEEEEDKTPRLIQIAQKTTEAITSGLGTIATIATGIGTTLLSILAAVKSGVFGGAADDVIDGIDGAEGDDKKKKGRRGKGGRGILSKAKGLAGRAVGAIGSSGLARGAASLGARAVAGVAAAGIAPVVGTAVAVAGAGYGLFKVVNYFVDRSEVEPLEKLRFMQYGLDTDAYEDYIPLIRQLEEDIDDATMYDKNKQTVIVNVDMDTLVNDFAADWGVDLDNQEDIDTWATWVAHRVIPVWKLHFRAKSRIDEGLDLRDIDDELNDDFKEGFIRGVMPGPSEKGFYDVGEGPGLMAPPLLMAPIIRDYMYSLYGEFGGNVRQRKQIRKKQQKMHDDGKLMEEQAKANQAKMQTQEKKKQQMSAGTGTYTPRSATTDVIKTSGGAALSISKDRLNSDGTSKKTGKLALIRPCSGVLTSPYGYRWVGGKQEMHRGIDIADPQGTPIYAAADGTIVRREYSTSYGYVIYMKHNNGWHTRYAHLYSFATLKLGDEVKQGEVIGYMGNTGQSRGVHLHFELRDGYGNDSSHYDPLKYIVEAKADTDAIKQAEKDAKTEESGDMDDTIEGINTLTPDKGENPSESIQNQEAVSLNNAVNNATSAQAGAALSKANIKSVYEAEQNALMASVASGMDDAKKKNQVKVTALQAMAQTNERIVEQNERMLKALEAIAAKDPNFNVEVKAANNKEVEVKVTQQGKAKDVKPVIDLGMG
jgi:murein DD-endopeptidase MepM/ murein hydrolase activator NlpD